MSRNLKFLGIAVALLAVVLAGIVLITLSLPTPAPSKKSVDFLKVIQALSDTQSRVEAQKSNAASATTLLPELSEAERQQILQQSDGLIRRVDLRPEGAIAVQAIISSNQQNDNAQITSVSLLLVPERVGEKYEWQCFGEPVSALPTFCKTLR